MLTSSLGVYFVLCVRWWSGAPALEPRENSNKPTPSAQLGSSAICGFPEQPWLALGTSLGHGIAGSSQQLK